MKQLNDIRSAPVSQYMSTDVVTIDGSKRVSEVVALMKTHGISSVMVNPRDDSDVYGIVTEKDVLAKVIDPGKETFVDIWNTQAHSIMTKPLVTINPQMSVKYAIRLMHNIGVRRLPVMDGTKLVGIISETNILHVVETLPVSNETAL